MSEFPLHPKWDWKHPFAPDTLVGRYVQGKIDWEDIKAHLRERKARRRFPNMRRATYDGTVQSPR